MSAENATPGKPQFVTLVNPDTPEETVYARGDLKSCETWAAILRERGGPAAIVPIIEKVRWAHESPG